MGGQDGQDKKIFGGLAILSINDEGKAWMDKMGRITDQNLQIPFCMTTVLVYR